MTGSDRLPAAFRDQMAEQLGEEADAFLGSFSLKSSSGIRLNTAKLSKEELPFPMRRVPWCKNGYYIDGDAALSAHPYYYAGCYYIQEPSAMLPAVQLCVKPGELVLDLCAAPGGKATELALQLKGKGLLIANDVSAARAKALLKNLTLWGAPNSCITVETPQRLLEKCGCCFDKILVDAPCSGEGMFRRDPSVISAWEKRGPSFYAPLQRQILSLAVQMLKPGGRLLYSTCTFSQRENEAVVSAVLQDFPELRLIRPERRDGCVPGIGGEPLDCCLRLYPHRAEGEGHFLALMEKSFDSAFGGRGRSSFAFTEERRSQEQIPEAVSSFLARLPETFLEQYRFAQIREQCLLLPPYQLPRLRYLRTGVRIGVLKSGRFEPSQDLAMLLTAKEFDAVLDLAASDPRTLRYLKGETLLLEEKEQKQLEPSENGWVLVCTDGHALGWGKLSNGKLKNKLYPGWRYQGQGGCGDAQSDRGGYF